MQQMQEIHVPPLGWEDSLEKEMATHSRILAWKISRTEVPSGQQSMGSQSDMTEHKHAHIHVYKSDRMHVETVLIALNPGYT